MTTTLAAVYADGWQNGVVNPLTRVEAEARDASGEPYAVLFVADGRLDTVLQVSWRDRYCEAIRFDAKGRMVADHVFRSAGERELFLFDCQTWAGADDAGRHEFPHVAAHRKVRYGLDGRRLVVERPQGDRGWIGHTQGLGPAPRLPIPSFGQWEELLELAGPGDVTIADAIGSVLPIAEADGPAWRPPVPQQPGNPDALFVPGAEYHVQDHVLRIEVHEAGVLRLPSGRIIAHDPGWLNWNADAYTVTVPPGEYPVTISLARFVANPDHTRVAAARLTISRQPVQSWEMALRDGQDMLDLGNGEFFGISVDAGMAAFIDAESLQRVVDLEEDLWDQIDPCFGMVEGQTMAAWSSGWGDGHYPVWIGRDGDGRVVCFIADMLLFPSGDEDGE